MRWRERSRMRPRIAASRSSGEQGFDRTTSHPARRARSGIGRKRRVPGDGEHGNVASARILLADDASTRTRRCPECSGRSPRRGDGNRMPARAPAVRCEPGRHEIPRRSASRRTFDDRPGHLRRAARLESISRQLAPGVSAGPSIRRTAVRELERMQRCIPGARLLSYLRS